MDIESRTVELQRKWCCFLALRRIPIATLLATLAIGHIAGGCSKGPKRSQTADKAVAVAETEVERRARLDKTVWAPELAAQRYEMVIVRLWDTLRESNAPASVLRDLSLRGIGLPGTYVQTQLMSSITKRVAQPTVPETLSPTAWKERVDQWAEAGYRLDQSEWHHERFEPGKAKVAPTSDVRFELHVSNRKSGSRSILRGVLNVVWQEGSGRAPAFGQVTIKELVVLETLSPPIFKESVVYDSRSQPILPVLVHDVDRDGDLDVALPGHNALLRNFGGNIAPERLFATPPKRIDNLVQVGNALFVDLTGDGLSELLVAQKDAMPQLYTASKTGVYNAPPRTIRLKAGAQKEPSAITAGDIDGDGDIDLLLAQYRPPFVGGQMPTPYFDSNDGHPTTLLINDGQGQFTDGTVGAGLQKKRYRRTYSASFAHLDDDSDLDLVVVSDFAGVDLYRNDGKGRFTDVSNTWLPIRNTFGMSHLLRDIDQDGRLDLYVAGMSSTTARRLSSLGLGLDEYQQHQQMRSVMGYGNRLYSGTPSGFSLADATKTMARSGWSWGTAAFDMDNDGRDEVFVANGHISGKTAQDYCTEFWRHDIYTGSSEEDPKINRYFEDRFRDRQAQGISWNGFEHNHLFTQVSTDAYHNLAYLFGLAAEDDSRAAIATDLDGDGRVDLLVSVSPSPRSGKFRLLFYRNVSSTQAHWIGFRLPTAMRGGLLRLKTKSGVRAAQYVTGDSFLSQHPPQLHFGLGQDADPVSVSVVWPDGTTWSSSGLKPDQYHTIPYGSSTAR